MGAGGVMGGTANSQMEECSGLKLTCGSLQCEKISLEVYDKKRLKQFNGGVLRLEDFRNEF